MVEPYDGTPPPLADETRDLGLILHDVRYREATGRYSFPHAWKPA